MKTKEIKWNLSEPKDYREGKNDLQEYALYFAGKDLTLPETCNYQEGYYDEEEETKFYS